MSPGARYGLVAGADRPFGAEIVDRLRADGGVVVGDIAALPDDAPLAMVVANLSHASPDIRFRSIAADDLRAVLDRQLYAFVAAIQAAVPRMTAGGAIVQVTSKAHLGAWGAVHVAAAAAACVAMARSMAIELAPLGIRVNSVATDHPGAAWDDPAVRADVAATVAWLGGPDSGRVTGETLLVDGGASLQMAQAARRPDPLPGIFRL